MKKYIKPIINIEEISSNVSFANLLSAVFGVLDEEETLLPGDKEHSFDLFN